MPSGTVEAGLAELALAGAGRGGAEPTGASGAARAACFHCGEPCGDGRWAKGEKLFCCQGCLFVHELLTERGLGQYYELSRAPGARARPARREQWGHLDAPALQERLLDFTDGKVSRITLRVPAIHCVACVWLLENLFRLHPGIGQSVVNFPKREVAVTFATQKLALSELVALLASIGYEPQLTLGELEPRKADPARRRQWLQVGIAGFAFGNIMLLSLPVYFGLDSLNGPLFRALAGWLSLALAAPVVGYAAADYWRSAWLSFRQRTLTLDVPIALGLAALYARSAYEIASGRGEGYLDSLTGLVFFLLCGRVFQQKTHERLVFERDYKCFFPLAAARLGAAGEESVAICDVRVGDRLRVRHGELIPADARLVSGEGLLDYSFVTGEAEPVAKAVGAYLYAGGQQVGGAIEVETLKPVSQSYLSSLWDHEAFRKPRQDALNTLTNRYARVFTVAVVALAAAAGLIWLGMGQAGRGLKAFTSVLIVACPCALALAAPFTLGTAQRLLARRRVFLKNGLVLERLAQVDSIVFDKTGTLTTAGAAEVSDFRFSVFDFRSPEGRESLPAGSAAAGREGEVPGLSAAEAGWVRSLAGQSRHPHARRIAAWLAGRGPLAAVEGFAESPGGGIVGTVAGHELRLGARAWLEQAGAAVPELGPAAGSVVCLAIDGRFRGAFVLANALRPEADALLRELGPRYEVALLSGDNERERGRFQALLGGGAELHFYQSPVDKLDYVRRLQERGRTVLMIGDGLNDAGALKQSDVGVAVVENIGAFSPASDVILEAGELAQLRRVLRLAGRATQIVRLSFGISAAYNAVGVAIAGLGLLSPVLCAILMPASSVSVVLFACGATNWAARRIGLN